MPLPRGVKLAVGGRAGIRNEASVPIIKPLGIRNKVSIRSVEPCHNLWNVENQICRQQCSPLFSSPGFRAGFLNCRPSIVLLHTYHSFVPKSLFQKRKTNKGGNIKNKQLCML